MGTDERTERPCIRGHVVALDAPQVHVSRGARLGWLRLCAGMQDAVDHDGVRLHPSTIHLVQHKHRVLPHARLAVPSDESPVRVAIGRVATAPHLVQVPLDRRPVSVVRQHLDRSRVSVGIRADAPPLHVSPELEGLASSPLSSKCADDSGEAHDICLLEVPQALDGRIHLPRLAESTELQVLLDLLIASRRSQRRAPKPRLEAACRPMRHAERQAHEPVGA
mmetsp:Transcript_3392/g.13518  ORF Transcript_3392/g.13518 Transcript_3392/m.13518 type:complete len:222 (-) Transcript_3392:227-892(-)